MSLRPLTHSTLPPPLTALDRSFAAWLNDQQKKHPPQPPLAGGVGEPSVGTRPCLP